MKCFRSVVALVLAISACIASAAPPAPPTNATAVAISPGRANVSWIDNSSDETNFVVERKRGSTGTWSVIASPPANAVTYHDAAVSPTNAYFYRVKAVNTDGESAYATTVNAAVTPAAGTLTVPGAPTTTCIWYSRNRLS